jgi:hypothetical protein
VAFDRCVVSGSAIERGTEPSAASCSTTSTPAQALRQVASSAMSPVIATWLRQRSSPTAERTLS